MTFALNFRGVPLTPAHADIVLTEEDFEKAREIGVLTPRSVLPSDRVLRPPIVSDGSSAADDAIYDQAVELSWAERASGKKGLTPQNLRDMDLDEVEFLLMVAEQEGDENENIMDDLILLWMEDMDATVWDLEAPFGHKACWPEVLQPRTTTVVRVVIDKGSYLIGSIAGQQPNVYIPKNLFNQSISVTTGAPVDVQQDEDDEDFLHRFHLLDLVFTPGQRNMWKAVGVHRLLPTDQMRLPAGRPSPVPSANSKTYNYEVPMPTSYIGAIIGKNGKNINALITRVNEAASDGGWRDVGDVPPEITLEPSPCGEKILVSILVPPGCEWYTIETDMAVSYMHS